MDLNAPTCTEAVVHDGKVFGPVLHAGMMNEQPSRWCKETWDSRSQVWLQENMPTGVKYSQQVWEETRNPGEREEVQD